MHRPAFAMTAASAAVDSAGRGSGEVQAAKSTAATTASYPLAIVLHQNNRGAGVQRMEIMMEIATRERVV
jgi:hypothetical protein